MMSNVNYLKNPYIRGRLMEVLHTWIPQNYENQSNLDGR